jgi:hypothetical protein
LSDRPSPHQEWLQDAEELPPRPRRRLLAPVPLALLGVLLIACGFIGGVLVEKGQTSSSSSTSGATGLASRFAALRSSASGAGTSRGSGASAGSSPGGSAGGSVFFGAGTSATAGSGASATVGSGASATVGQVAYISGSTLYVTNAEGNTVKVTTSPASTVTKTVKASVKGIHPGETVIVTGASSADGTVSAESIRVGTGGGGLGALFAGGGAGNASGGGSGSSGSGSGSGKSASGGGGEPALFGNGG